MTARKTPASVVHWFCQSESETPLRLPIVREPSFALALIFQPFPSPGNLYISPNRKKRFRPVNEQQSRINPLASCPIWLNFLVIISQNDCETNCCCQYAKACFCYFRKNPRLYKASDSF